jgi:hypothetical protein
MTVTSYLAAEAARQAERARSVIGAEPRVRTVTVQLDEAGPATTLLAYVETEPDAPDGAELRDLLRAARVDAMPVDFVRLPRLLPGADDRLPRPGDPTAGPAPGEADLQDHVTAAWQAALGGPIGLSRDFFDGGGNSFRAARAVAAVRSAIGVDVPLRTIFEHPTVEAFTAAVGSAVKRQPVRLVRLQDGGGRPLILLPDVGGGVDYAYRLLRHLPPELPVYGLLWRGAGPASVTAMADVLAGQVAKMIPPEGAYLCAQGAAGVLAVRLARGLAAADVPTATVLLHPAERPGDAAEAVAREALAEFSAACRRGLFRAVPPADLWSYLGGRPEPVLAALSGPDAEPGDGDLDSVLAATGPTLGAAAVDRLTALLHRRRDISDALGAHPPEPAPYGLTAMVPPGAPTLPGWVTAAGEVAVRPLTDDRGERALAAGLRRWLGDATPGPGKDAS